MLCLYLGMRHHAPNTVSRTIRVLNMLLSITAKASKRFVDWCSLLRVLLGVDFNTYCVIFCVINGCISFKFNYILIRCISTCCNLRTFIDTPYFANNFIILLAELLDRQTFPIILPNPQCRKWKGNNVCCD